MYYMKCNYVLKSLPEFSLDLEVRYEDTTCSGGVLESRACRISWGQRWRSKMNWLKNWQQKLKKFNKTYPSLSSSTCRLPDK
jgi:hypothetical protein